MTTDPMRALGRELAGGASLVLDGATGGEIERRVTLMHERAWCAMATILVGSGVDRLILEVLSAPDLFAARPVRQWLRRSLLP